uniref:Uncharacterized protein n=1 Tax=Arundo donax TaxID=35708 RepID=A0A0A9MGV3_ARUDO
MEVIPQSGAIMYYGAFAWLHRPYFELTADFPSLCCKHQGQ